MIDPRMSSSEIRRTLQRMANAIAHRGPNEERFFVADGVGLAIRRLSSYSRGGHEAFSCHIILSHDRELCAGLFGSHSSRIPTSATAK